MVVAVSALLCVLPSPAAAWEVTSPNYRVLRIEREDGDATGTVQIYTGNVSYARNADGSWDESSTSPYVALFGVLFDEDDVSWEWPVSGTNHLVITPEGDCMAACAGGGAMPVAVQNQAGTTLTVAASVLPPVSIAGTPTVAVSSYPTPPVGSATMSVEGTVPVSIAGTVPVDAFWQAGIPQGWAGAGVSLITLLSGFGSAVVFRRV